jgi:MFS family permease
MSEAALDGDDAHLKAAKRNVALFVAVQATLGSATPLCFSVGALAGYHLLGDGDKSIATAPLTGLNIGVATGAIVAAFAAKYLGRKQSFMLGAILGAIGGATAGVALFRLNFWLFAAGLLMIGLCAGFTQKIRFAAADVSPPAYKPKAISWILAGGIISAIIGPQLAIWMKDLFAPVIYAGAFIALVPLCLMAVAILSCLDLPDTQSPGITSAEAARPLMEIVTTARFVTGLVCGTSSFALMTFVMTGAPLAMVVGCGFSTELATLGIQWHVLAMFAPSFFTGLLIARFGSERIVAAGMLILMACAVVAHMGIVLWNFWGALILLGIGWNFGFIGGTAIVASSYRRAEADKVQGFHDIVLFSLVALSSFSSGKIFTAYGWSVMNLAIWPLTVVSLMLLALLLRQGAAKPA